MKTFHVGRGPKISVIVPVYNQELYLGRCLRSLLSQSYPPDSYEIIVIDDGSTDMTAYALSQFGDSITVLRNEENQGLPYSLNRGLEVAKSDFIVRVDADDYVNKDFLNFLSSWLHFNTTYSAVGCDYFLIDKDENVIERRSASNDPIACGIMFNREVFDVLGGYNEEFLLHEDLEFRERFETRFHIGFLEIPLYRYRRHEGNITNDDELNRLFRDKLNAKR